MEDKLRYDYYLVTVPSDAFGTVKDAEEWAIGQARESAHLYVLPCDWRATLLYTGCGVMRFRVRRRRLRPGGARR